MFLDIFKLAKNINMSVVDRDLSRIEVKFGALLWRCGSVYVGLAKRFGLYRQRGG